MVLIPQPGPKPGPALEPSTASATVPRSRGSLAMSATSIRCTVPEEGCTVWVRPLWPAQSSMRRSLLSVTISAALGVALVGTLSKGAGCRSPTRPDRVALLVDGFASAQQALTPAPMRRAKRGQGASTRWSAGAYSCSEKKEKRKPKSPTICFNQKGVTRGEIAAQVFQRAACLLCAGTL